MDENKLKKEPIGSGIFINTSKNHTFGTDAILLASFAAVKKTDRCVDLGTGCGIIPFLWLRENKLLSVTGVDISEEACRLAKQTKAEMRFNSLQVINSDLNSLKGKIEFGCHTLVTCNPPYKASGAGIMSENERDAVSRHETACTLKDIIAVSSRLLQTSGRLCMCHRPERLAELMSVMRENKIEPKRLRLVCKTPKTAPWLVLVEGKKCSKSGMIIEPSLFIQNGEGGFSKEMIEIYGCYKEDYL